MLNCHDATQLMSEAQERPLKFGEKMALRFHVGMCSGCRNFGKQMGTIRSIARAYVKHRDNGESSDA